MAETVEEQLDIKFFTNKQAERFSMLCERVRNGEISANKSYEYAKADGDDEDNKGFNGTFKDWVDTATTKGWLNVIETPKVELEPTKKTNYVLPILIGVGVAIVLIYAIKKFSKKD